MHSYIHYPPSTDVEAYTDAIPPMPVNSSTILSYSDACWGLQIGSAVADGTLLPLFKFCSMNGGIVFKNGTLSVGLATAKIKLPLAPARQKSVPPVLLQRNLLISGFSARVCPTPE
jgi:hypothetical protein